MLCCSTYVSPFLLISLTYSALFNICYCNQYHVYLRIPHVVNCIIFTYVSILPTNVEFFIQISMSKYPYLSLTSIGAQKRNFKHLVMIPKLRASVQCNFALTSNVTTYKIIHAIPLYKPSLHATLKRTKLDRIYLSTYTDLIKGERNNQKEWWPGNRSCYSEGTSVIPYQCI